VRRRAGGEDDREQGYEQTSAQERIILPDRAPFGERPDRQFGAAYEWNIACQRTASSTVIKPLSFGFAVGR